MRTTLSIADDVLSAVREKAARENRSIGDVLSDLARSALLQSPVASTSEVRNGFRPLAHRGPAVSNALIDRLRDDEDD